ncbi:MAG: hypothetical protein H6799_02350 [Candidatus Nomurabacteria bacterium]|nr:MAG: hypothetical protein H6799_02350 [Candidatus Nomurabacteria bacterium]
MVKVNFEVVGSTLAVAVIGVIISAIGYGAIEIASRDEITLDSILIHSDDCSESDEVGDLAFGDVDYAQEYADEHGGPQSVCYVVSEEYTVGGTTTEGKIWYSVR